MGSGTGHRRGRGGKRLKHQESSEQRSSLGGRSHVDHRAAAAVTTAALNLPLGPPTTSSSWPSVGSQSSIPAAPFAPGMLPIFPVYPPMAHPFPQPLADPSRFPLAPMVTPPMMAFVLPNYVFPQVGAAPAPPGHFYNPNLSQLGANVAATSTAVASASNPVLVPATCAPSRSSTPQSYCQTPAERDGAESPLFQSRCSSPLNLLQLEESPSNRLEVTTASQQATSSTQGGTATGQGSANKGSSNDVSKENENENVSAGLFFGFFGFFWKIAKGCNISLFVTQGETNESNQDAMSTSSDLLDLMLQEDSRSGTGSAASGSGSSGTRSSGSGSGSNGCSSTGTSGTSKFSC